MLVGGLAGSWSGPCVAIVGGGLELPRQASGMHRQDVIRDRRTAKWTANAHRLAGTHGHSWVQEGQVGAIEAQAGALLLLHGMQEVRGSTPLSSTFSQVNGHVVILKNTL